jgi:hypothetical protein
MSTGREKKATVAETWLLFIYGMGMVVQLPFLYYKIETRLWHVWLLAGWSDGTFRWARSSLFLMVFCLVGQSFFI